MIHTANASMKQNALSQFFLSSVENGHLFKVGCVWNDDDRPLGGWPRRPGHAGPLWLWLQGSGRNSQICPGPHMSIAVSSVSTSALPWEQILVEGEPQGGLISSHTWLVCPAEQHLLKRNKATFNSPLTVLLLSSLIYDVSWYPAGWMNFQCFKTLKTLKMWISLLWFIEIPCHKHSFWDINLLSRRQSWYLNPWLVDCWLKKSMVMWHVIGCWMLVFRHLLLFRPFCLSNSVGKTLWIYSTKKGEMYEAKCIKRTKLVS